MSRTTEYIINEADRLGMSPAAYLHDHKERERRERELAEAHARDHRLCTACGWEGYYVTVCPHCGGVL